MWAQRRPKLARHSVAFVEREGQHQASDTGAKKGNARKLSRFHDRHAPVSLYTPTSERGGRNLLLQAAISEKNSRSRNFKRDSLPSDTRHGRGRSDPVCALMAKGCDSR